MPKGPSIIIDPDAVVSEHDGVICKTGEGPVKIGQIVDAEDGWRIISPVWGNALIFKADEEGIIHRIIGYYHPEVKGKIYPQK